jgi:xylan 1,4-beta-xylosidase
LWNYREVRAPGAGVRKVSISFAQAQAQAVQVQTLDEEHGNFANAYLQMGSPRYPSQEQLNALRTSAALPAPTSIPLDGQQRVNLDIPPDALMLVTLKPGSEKTH